MIKRRLATLAPQMKIFLDVDDLEEFGTLADRESIFWLQAPPTHPPTRDQGQDYTTPAAEPVGLPPATTRPGPRQNRVPR